jgi:hypothetical protein
MATTNDRRADVLYASLTPQERARMLARLWREHNGRELDRLRETIPDATAGAAYNRVVTLLRNLNGPMLLAGLAALRNGLEADGFALIALNNCVANRRIARAYLQRIWRLLAYPVAESEYRALRDIQRSELWPLDAYAESLAELDGTEPGLHSAVKALLLSLPADLRREYAEPWKLGDPPPHSEAVQEDIRRADEITARIRRLIDAAIKRGELPKPRRRDGELCLPIGTLRDWGEDTTAETFEPYGPEYHIPSLELFGGSCATWEIHPDNGAEAVRTRRQEMRNVFASIVAEAGPLADDELAGVDLEPTKTLAERERSREDVQRIWPWATVERDAFRGLGARTAIRRAELRAYTDVLEHVQNEDFGGEDPLAPEARPFLDAAWASARNVDEIWRDIAEPLAPHRPEDVGPWPPPLYDEAYYVSTRLGLEQMFRGDYGE